MKSCKKITSAVIALVLMFSALTCVSYAQPDETASSVTSSTWYGPEDMTYGPTKPQPTFTLPGSGSSSGMTEPAKGIKAMLQNFLNKINDLFNIFLNWFDKVGQDAENNG